MTDHSILMRLKCWDRMENIVFSPCSKIKGSWKRRIICVSRLFNFNPSAISRDTFH